MRRRETFWELMAVLIVIALAGGVILNVREAKHQEYCRCLGSQPYINTKYHNGRCLTNVISYEDIDVAETIFIAQEYCR